MNKVYQVYQVSDSTGEALDRIFLAIKAQFLDFECKTVHYSFTTTINQIDKIITKCKEEKNVIILYTIVDKELSFFTSYFDKYSYYLSKKSFNYFTKDVISLKF